MLIEKLKTNILNYHLIKQDEVVLIGVSGGPDSMTLLHSLNSLKEELGFSIVVVHVNHMLRGTESDLDCELVKDFCNKFKLKVIVKKVDIAQKAAQLGMSIEETAREMRYLAFANESKLVGANKIAVAHNINDQAETIMMNILRGCGSDGLRGMQFVRGNIIRPLLSLTRAEIEEYCEFNSIKTRIDSSNLEAIYTRNKVRLELIPYINQNFRCDITKSLTRLATIISQENDFMDEYTTFVYNNVIKNETVDEICVDKKEFEKLHLAIQKKLIRKIIEKLRGTLKKLENINVEKAIDLIINGKTGAKLNLPKGVNLYKSYEVVKFSTAIVKSKNKHFTEVVNYNGDVVIENVGKIITQIDIEKKIIKKDLKLDNSAYEQCFDYDKIKDSIVVRNRREGDIIKIVNSRGSKKLKEFFIDYKIEKEIRDFLPLIAIGNDIVWVVGYAISDKYKVTNMTQNTLRIRFEKFNEPIDSKLKSN